MNKVRIKKIDSWWSESSEPCSFVFIRYIYKYHLSFFSFTVLMVI